MSDEPSDLQWLTRLDATGWLNAARNELVLCAQAFERKADRAAITHARRAAGMALNAVLRVEPDKVGAWGRSYMDHLRALADNPDADANADAPAAALRQACQTLVQTAPVAPVLVHPSRLNRDKSAQLPEVLRAAQSVVTYCEARSL